MLDRKEAPKSYLLDDLTLAEVEKRSLENGVHLHLLADDTNPVIKIDIQFPFGKYGEQKAGLAVMSSKLMLESTLSYPSSELQETLDHYGAHADVAIEYDDTAFSLICLKEHAHVLLPLLKSILTEPSFDEKDFDKLKYQMVQKAKVNNAKNAFLATKAFREKLLNGSPYAVVADEESLNSITLADIQTFYNSHYNLKPDIFVAGDIDDEIILQIESLFGILKFETTLEPLDFELQSLYGIHEIKREGAVQASLRLGTLSIDKSHEDYFKLSIANEILGGYFGSRLMKNIREDKGYTYGIYSMIINYNGLSYQIIGADIKHDAIDDAIAECMNEINTMQHTLVSEEELSTVKNYMLGKLAGHLDTIFSQSDNYRAKVAEGIDYQQYFDKYVRTIKEISAADIKEVSQKYFSNDFCTIKVV